MENRSFIRNYILSGGNQTFTYDERNVNNGRRFDYDNDLKVGIDDIFIEAMELRNKDVVYEIWPRYFAKAGAAGSVFDEILLHADRLKAMGVSMLWHTPIHSISYDRTGADVGSPYAVLDYNDINPEYTNDSTVVTEPLVQNGSVVNWQGFEFTVNNFNAVQSVKDPAGEELLSGDIPAERVPRPFFGYNGSYFSIKTNDDPELHFLPPCSPEQWPVDGCEPNEHVNARKWEFKMYVQALHNKGLKFMLDIVSHHCGFHNPIVWKYPDMVRFVDELHGDSWAFRQMAWYDTFWWNVRSDEYASYMKRYIEFFVREYEIDGIRLDVVDLYETIQCIEKCLQSRAVFMRANELTE